MCKKESFINCRQTDEMRVAVEALEAGSTEKSINDMAGRHFEEQSLLQGYWGSRIDALRLDQRRQYRNWIMRMLEEQQTSMIPTPVYVFLLRILILINVATRLKKSYQSKKIYILYIFLTVIRL